MLIPASDVKDKRANQRPDVEAGILPFGTAHGRLRPGQTSDGLATFKFVPPGETPGPTAGKMPTATLRLTSHAIELRPGCGWRSPSLLSGQRQMV